MSLKYVHNQPNKNSLPKKEINPKPNFNKLK